MQLEPVIEFLTNQKLALEETIACLERLRATGGPPLETPATGKRRGRKFMGQADRERVSARMKEYWQARRSQKVHAASGG